MSRQRRLGKGIDALLQGRDLGTLESGDLNSVLSVPIEKVQPNPEQPRKTFTPEALEELARSIEERGIIQPILAEQRDDGTYIIIAGERRFRAAAMAGLTVVPILPGVFSEDEKLEIALIENIQRQNLTPMEEARAYRELMERSGLSQEELAHRLGKSRPAVANSLRLLRLPEDIQEQVNNGILSAGHARTLLALDDGQRIVEMSDIVLRDGLSVRALERLVTSVNDGHSPDTDRSDKKPSPAPVQETAARKTVEMAEIEQHLLERLGTRVILTGSNNRGKIEISYLSMDDLERIVGILVPGYGENG